MVVFGLAVAVAVVPGLCVGVTAGLTVVSGLCAGVIVAAGVTVCAGVTTGVGVTTGAAGVCMGVGVGVALGVVVVHAVSVKNKQTRMVMANMTCQRLFIMIGASFKIVLDCKARISNIRGFYASVVVL